GIGGTFMPQMADHDVLKLEEYYKSHGYQDINVSRELVYDENYRTVDLVFHIHEGVRYRVKDVQIEGSTSFDRNELASLTKLKSGNYFSKQVVEGDLNNITSYIGWRGRLASAQPELFVEEPGVVRVRYEVNEKTEARVGEVKIIGNEVTRDNVIRRVIGLYPGQILRYPELRIAE